MTRALNYNLRLKQASLIVELYLPKKASFQGSLYDTLSEGLDILNVRAHFRNSARSRRISSTLVVPHLQKLVKDTGRMRRFPRVFFGYSLYEVDGVFANKKGPPDEESTQVVRMLFGPDTDALSRKVKLAPYRTEQIVRAYQHARRVGEPSVQSADFKEFDDVGAKDLKEVVDHLRDWYRHVEVFVFGFVVFRLCEKIKELKGKGLKAEEEIWVTTTDAMLQRVVLCKS